MIAAVPEIYPDELVLSFCARYHQRMGYRSRESSGRDLFGKAMTKPAIDFPSRLERLAHAYIFGAWITVDGLIDDHTLLPFYQPFVPPNRINQIRKDMRESRGGALHARIGVLTNSVRDQNLRFCPACVQKDRSTFGETYWHRLHQLPGIDICPEHQVFLEDSSEHPCPQTRKGSFVTAEQSITDIQVRKLDKSNRDQHVYLKLAQDARWLLDHPNFASTHSLDELYSRWFYTRGLSWFSGQVKVTVLCEQIKSHYSPALLNRFNCVTDRWNNWVRKLIHEMDRAHHPVEHLLIIQFLGLSIEEFFEPPPLRSPFGDGPWPCLNPTSTHFRNRVINEYELISSKQRKTSTAVFECSCGLIYYRNDRRSSVNNHGQAAGFLSITSSWLKALKREKESFSNAELAERFCTSHKTILNLLFRAEFIAIDGTAPTSEQVFRVGFPNRNSNPAQRNKNRETWLKRRAENPDLTRSVLQKRYAGLATWLANYDRKWFEKHLPPRRKQAGPPPRFNWPEQDELLAQAVRKQADLIRLAPGKPVRISFTSLGRQIGKLAVVTKRGHLVPLTKQALSDVAETAEDCAVRRVNWASKTLREEGINPSKWQIRSKAVLSTKMAEHPLVNSAIEQCIRSGATDKRKTLKTMPPAHSAVSSLL